MSDISSDGMVAGEYYYLTFQSTDVENQMVFVSAVAYGTSAVCSFEMTIMSVRQCRFRVSDKLESSAHIQFMVVY